MKYISEFVGSLTFLGLGYAYMCNISLKNTLVSKMKYIELVVAWSLAVGLGLAIAVIMGGPAYLNPGVVIGQIVLDNLSITEAAKFIFMEFLAAGAAVGLCSLFFHDSMLASPEEPKRGIFSAYPVNHNLVQNSIQEFIATFIFLFFVLTACSVSSTALEIGLIGFSCVGALALTFNSTGFSMNAMRSVFSSVWFEIFKAVKIIPTSKDDKVNWKYQLIVNGIASTLGGVLAVYITSLF